MHCKYGQKYDNTLHVAPFMLLNNTVMILILIFSSNRLKNEENLKMKNIRMNEWNFFTAASKSCIKMPYDAIIWKHLHYILLRAAITSNLLY